MQWLSELAKEPWYIFFAGFVAGAPLALWADYLLRKYVDKSSAAFKDTPTVIGYTETRLRLRLDPAGSGYHLLESQSNIANWQQIFLALTELHDLGESKIGYRADCISIIFAVPTVYARPIIDTFGSNLKSYNFHPQDTNGYVVVAEGLANVGLIEIWFPPPDHYESRTNPR